MQKITYFLVFSPNNLTKKMNNKRWCKVISAI